MKNQIKLILVFALVAIGSKTRAQTSEASRDLGIFNAVEVANSIEAELIKGEAYKVEIFASGIDESNIETEVEDRQLKVKIGKGSFGSNSVKVKITYAGELDKIEASTSAKIFVKDVIKSKNLTLFAQTSSYLEAKVNVLKLKLEANTNGKLFVEGSTTDLDLEAYTKANISADGLVTENAEVRTNTAAESVVTVKSSIKGTAGTAGKVWYIGDPGMVDVKTNTGGDIARKKN
ncbi:DUF2807 domain-containing protein [Echinicola sp. CAU 1574]|uniref:DUF2807 domain-containing protein n=1 Tax=Echinicola arenosa TaxID=2774144 RepID=A0ABR9AGR9_9BACT|nr:head GIN domain-containing protein [Echinicola arenosa]MBD8487948.1 DUF2807 domain-containing protein [Echinicola arenosa]